MYLYISLNIAHQNVDLLFRPHALFPFMTYDGKKGGLL